MSDDGENIVHGKTEGLSRISLMFAVAPLPLVLLGYVVAIILSDATNGLELDGYGWAGVILVCCALLLSMLAVLLGCVAMWPDLEVEEGSAWRVEGGGRLWFGVFWIVLILVCVVMRLSVLITHLKTPYYYPEMHIQVTVEAIVRAQASYHSANGCYGSFKDLAETTPPLLEIDFTTPQMGHVFKLSVQEDRFSLRVGPVAPGRTGKQWYYVDETGVIRRSEDGPADVSSPAI